MRTQGRHRRWSRWWRAHHSEFPRIKIHRTHSTLFRSYSTFCFSVCTFATVQHISWAYRIHRTIYIAVRMYATCSNRVSVYLIVARYSWYCFREWCRFTFVYIKSIRCKTMDAPHVARTSPMREFIVYMFYAFEICRMLWRYSGHVFACTLYCFHFHLKICACEHGTSNRMDKE